MADNTRTFEKLIVTPHTKDLKEFEDLVKGAKEIGTTHVVISELLQRTDFRGDNAGSPWTEWSVTLPALFKHVTPPGLEEAYGKDFVRREMDFLKRKYEIAARHGMKAVYYANEPHWLSERVYAKHPEWRGPRCDNCLRTVGMFFAPCVDHPEILEAYRYAIREVIKAAPGLDTFIFMTNDSGSGFCWSNQLYVNPNGPSACANRNMGDRVVGFMRTLKQGAAEAGAKLEVYLPNYFPPEESANIISRLDPDMGMTRWGIVQDDLPLPRTITGFGGWRGMPTLVNGLCSPLAVVNGFYGRRRPESAKAAQFHIAPQDKDFFAAVKVSSSFPGAGSAADKVQAALILAEKLYAPDIAEDLVEAWHVLDRAGAPQNAIEVGWHMNLGMVGMRWLVRPTMQLVERLSPEETSYWQPFLYQSKEAQPEAWLDPMNQTGLPRVEGWSHARMIAKCTEAAAETLRRVAAMYQKAIEKTSSEPAKAKLKQDILRLKAHCCLLMTVRNTSVIAALEQDRLKTPPITSTIDPQRPENMKGSYGLMMTHRAMRWEIENITELISLMKQSPVPLLSTETDLSQEGTLRYGPNLLENLQKKVDIMMRHWRDVESVYYKPTLGG